MGWMTDGMRWMLQANNYHPICRKMVALDLGVDLGASGFDVRLVMAGAALVAIGLLLARRR